MVNKAIIELENNYVSKNSDFFEAYLILTLKSIKKKSYTETEKYLNQLYRYKDQGYVESAIYEILKNYAYLFENKKYSVFTKKDFKAKNNKGRKYISFINYDSNDNINQWGLRNITPQKDGNKTHWVHQSGTYFSKYSD